jgi:hypothetical protein
MSSEPGKPAAEKRHDLFSFMSQISDEMASEYERIRMRTTEDPGTAGDQGEENWANLLRDWLPSTYQIVTKGRLIGHDGTTSPQVDVIVLKPSYPKKLLGKKLYLSAGVAAAFECKTTLTAAHVREGVQNAVAIKSLFPARKGAPYRELRSPIIYGLLAHSHSWKAAGSDPLGNIDRHLLHDDASLVLHPRLGLDILCVADLAAWVAFVSTFYGPAFNTWTPVPGFEGGYASTAYIRHSKKIDGQADDFQSEHFTPIGTLISAITQKLAWEDPVAEDLAGYYRLSNLGGTGAGAQRPWPPTIYSDEIRERVIRGQLTSGIAYDEWGMAFT